jgi:hypothetical protein
MEMGQLLSVKQCRGKKKNGGYQSLVSLLVVSVMIQESS